MGPGARSEDSSYQIFSVTSNMRTPDFVIAGAPRCGTSSLASYVAAHPSICFSPIKEPNYFCTDSPRLRVVDSPLAYGRLFKNARAGQICGEGSTSYLFSRDALRRLLEANGHVKIILAVRNPIDMVASHHNQKVYAGEENERVFERAWHLSGARARGMAVGPACRAPRYLDYHSIGRLGVQIERAQRLVPSGQLHIVVFDDLQADAGAVYRGVLQFLHLNDDGRTQFPITNTRPVDRIPALGTFLRNPPPLLAKAKRRLRRVFPGPIKSIGRTLHGLNRAPAERAQISPEFRSELIDAFSADVALLSSLLGRNLDRWLTFSSA
jgi:hypothetical protein